MGNHEKKSESEVKVTRELDILPLERAYRQLLERVLALEKALVHVQHTNTDDGSRHQNDGGWFD